MPGKRLSCFAHSLQLVVIDVVTEVVSHTIAKTTRFTTLLHSRPYLRDLFEDAFDANKIIPAANKSTFKEAQALPMLDYKTLFKMCHARANMAYPS